MQCDVMGTGKQPASAAATSCQPVVAVDWRVFLEYYLHLPGILNDPFCCMVLLTIE